MKTDSQLAQPVAPEDIAAGDYVSVLHVLREQLPFFFDDDSFRERVSPRRVYVLPSCGAPMRVIELCLPYVLVESPGGKHRMIDLRRYRVARFSEQFGRIAFERMKPKDESSEKATDASTVTNETPSGDG